MQDQGIPISVSISYQLGYVQGQRLCQANAFLPLGALNHLANTSFLRASRTTVIDWCDYIRGLKAGYYDEREGLAHPLPPIDVPYRPGEIIFEHRFVSYAKRGETAMHGSKRHPHKVILVAFVTTDPELLEEEDEDERIRRLAIARTLKLRARLMGPSRCMTVTKRERRVWND